jgi:glycosyltransferase involved in cell wall biosynthesis
MRILQLPNLYFPSIGGIQRLVQDISEGMVRCGDDVTVFTSNLADGEVLKKRYYVREPALEVRRNFEVLNGVKVHRFAINHILHRLLYRPPEMLLPSRLHERLLRGMHGYRFFRKQPFCPSILRRIIRFRADITVVSNSASPFGYYCYLAKKLTGLPYVMHPSLHVGADWAQEAVTRKVLVAADGVIAQTSYERSHLLEMGVDEDRIRVIGSGIELRDTGPGKAGRSKSFGSHGDHGGMVLFLGRVVPGKGVETLIEAMPLVWREKPGVRLMVAGTVERGFLPVLKSALSRLSERDRRRVVFIDDFDEAEKYEIIRSCDVLAMPSRVDSYGIVYLEAWSQKKPVIALQDTAPSCLVDHGVDGLLVPHGDVEALADAILALEKAPRLRARMGENAYRKLKREFSMHRYIEKTREAYRDVLTARLRGTSADHGFPV